MDTVIRTNEQWLAALRSDGPEQALALADLRECLRRSAFFYLRRHGGDLKDLAAEEIAAVADDAAQEAAVSVLAKLDAFRGEARFLTWAAKFGIGCALAARRRRHWRDVSLERMSAAGAELAAAAVSRDGWGRPELAAQRQEIWAIMQQVTRDDLTERQRTAFSQILVQGVDGELVATQLGISQGALYKLLHDARRKFKKALERRGLSKDEILKTFANPG